MIPGAGDDGEMAILYQRISQAMEGIHNGTEKVDSLVRIANEWYVPTLLTSLTGLVLCMYLLSAVVY